MKGKLSMLAVMILAGCIMTTSCNETTHVADDSTVTVSGIGDGIDSVVPIDITYNFPQFLNDTDDISLFSNLIFNSFDYDTSNVKVTKQPFENLICVTSFLNGEYYSYRDGLKLGIVDKNGQVMLSAGYSEISMVRNDAFLLSRENSDEHIYAFINEKGKVSLDAWNKANWFTMETPIRISQTAENEDGKQLYFLETQNGKVVYDKYWDSLAVASFESAATEAYSGYIDGSFYFVLFDKYYNFKVYEGSYANVEVMIGGKYGSCYILSKKHYDEINTMFDSFGVKDTPRTVSSEKGSDYVKFTFSTKSSLRSSVTISPDGLCYVEATSPEDKKQYKYFNAVDKECFLSVIEWINKNLSEEYTKH